MTDAAIVEALRQCQERIRRTKNHRYQVYDGTRWDYMLGVTSIKNMLDKPHLLGWAAALGAETGDPMAHEKMRNESAALGKSLHAEIERVCRLMMGETVPESQPLTENELMALARWRKWATDAEFRPLAVEFFLYHAEHGYCGAPDALGYVRPLRADGSRGEPVLAILDWKTGGKRLYSEHDLQSVPYRVGLASMIGCDVPAGYLVHVPREGDRISERAATNNVELTMQAFLGLKAALLWQRAIDKELEAA